jgi:anti-anti-sigma regulatory factor
MMIVYHELLPQAYLLGLAPDPAATSELALAQHLSHALQSGKAAVWVDCRLLTSLSPAAVHLLCAYHRRLQRRQAQLVLCRVSGVLARVLHQASPDLCLAPTFDEAATQQCEGPFEG